MVKEKRILSYFIGWLILGFIICFIGIKNTYALIIDSKFLGQSVNTNLGTQPNGNITGQSSIVVNEESIANYFVVDLCTTLGTSYNISNIENYSGNTSLFKIYYHLGSCNTTNYNGTLSRIYFYVKEWSDAGNGNYGIIFGSRLNSTANYYSDIRILNIYTTDVVDNTSEIINNQTNELNNSINNSTNTITGSITDSENNINSNIQSSEDNINQNIDDMEQSIVDSNKETQDVIKDQFNSCRDSYNLLNNLLTTQTKNGIILTVNDDKSITLNGTSTSQTLFYISKDTWGYNSQSTILDAGTYTFKNIGTSYSRARLFVDAFNTSSVRIYGTQSVSNNNLTFTLNEKASFNIRLEIPSGVTFNNQKMYFQIQEGSVSTEYEVYGEEICSNKIDETNDALNNIGGALTDDSPTDMSGLGDSAGWLPAGPVDSILTLPLTLFTTLSNNLSNNTCTTAVLPLPFVNKNINLPCIKTLYDKIGITGTLFTTAGIIASCFILFNYLLSLYNWVDKTLTMRENTMPGYYDDNWGGGA